jgi:hypothetical protein
VRVHSLMLSRGVVEYVAERLVVAVGIVRLMTGTQITCHKKTTQHRVVLPVVIVEYCKVDILELRAITGRETQTQLSSAPDSETRTS